MWPICFNIHKLTVTDNLGKCFTQESTHITVHVYVLYVCLLSVLAFMWALCVCESVLGFVLSPMTLT